MATIPPQGSTKPLGGGMAEVTSGKQEAPDINKNYFKKLRSEFTILHKIRFISER